MSRMTDDEAAAEDAYDAFRSEIREEVLAEGVSDLQLQEVADLAPERIRDLVCRNPNLYDLIEAEFARRRFVPNPYR